MDLALLGRLVAELRPMLVGNRTDRIYAVPRYDVVLGSNSGRRHLWVSVEPDDPHIVCRNAGPRAERQPPAFAMAARKWGRGRRIARLDLVNSDRVLRVDWDGGGAFVAELVPRRATAYVLDAAGHVVAVWNPRRGRPGVGAVYAPPDRSRRGGPADLGTEDWRRLASLEPHKARHELMHSIHAMSRPAAEEILFRWRRGDGTLPDLTTDVLARIDADGPPTIYSAAPLEELREPVGDAKLLLAPCPLEHRADSCSMSFASVAEACEHFYDLRARLRLAQQVRSAVLRAVNDRLRRLARRRTEAPAEDVAERSAALRRRADLLLATPDAPIADGIVVVADVHASGAPVRIAIDAALDLPANAQRLYRRAQRLEARAQQSAASGVRNADAEAALTAIAEAANAMRTHAEIKAVLARAVEAGLPLPLERMRIAEAGTGHLLRENKRPSQDGGSGILRVTTATGAEILVGRNAANNDRLTHDVAGPRDWWLHAEGPGSHVVLRNPRRLEQPPPDALAAAAALAAWFSKSRSAAKVEVRWTQARRVRKPRGAPAGTALLDSYHSFVVAPRPPAEVAGGDARPTQ
jgi:predicted ribosome quality control (RQC) complex YloA/Tae2 family protein